MMTQAEQDRDLEDARSYLSCTSLTADRCRHESVTETALWFFETIGEGKRTKRVQVGSAHRVTDHSPSWARSPIQWEVTRMFNGQPAARCFASSLLEAVTYVVRYDYGRVTAMHQAMEA